MPVKKGEDNKKITTQHAVVTKAKLKLANVPMPVPASSGPVEPPKAPPSWWVWILVGFFLAITLGVVGYMLIVKPYQTKPDTVATNTPSPQQTNPSTVPTIYSYLSVVDPVLQSDHFTGDQSDCSSDGAALANLEVPTNVAEKTFVDLAIKTDSVYVDEASFRQDLERVGRLIDVTNKHKMHATLDLSLSFIEMALKLNVGDVGAWAKQGHEVALAFDPVVQLDVTDPSKAAAIPFGTWLLAVHKQQVEAQDLCACKVTTLTGGNSDSHLVQLGKALGLTAFTGFTKSDGTIPTELAVTNPWTIAKSGNLVAMQSFDPLGALVYVPSGVYPSSCTNGDIVVAPFTESHFAFTTKALYETIKSATVGKVNVFRFTVNVADFAEPSDDDTEFSAWESWLTAVVDPLIKSVKITSSTDAKTTQAFFTWLDQNIGKVELK